ncbi:MAG: EfeM/EfeO family lipoprotein [Spirulinaceae cyanobacterium RM2_2_10]|nr:EfeM/EfeO family lipoprotein [Spirulinaceae cyanobacterium SM2_1_0]NJO21522.1 EfeM/EfeO family lipoprotein [Spirulinaceae cyanobacterium RM2_2_10]
MISGLNFSSAFGYRAPELQSTEPVEVVADQNYAQEVEAGLRYFRQLAARQLELHEDLLAAVESGNLAAAKTAYVNARPPYEEIEVFAGSFEQEDSDIDARPYAFDLGEMSPEFKGVHRIEGFIYRDNDLRAAIPYAEELVATTRSLIAKLNDSSNFSAQSNFAGMIALAAEVPAKKISSEEETWSDQSLLIFKSNWDGIYSQYQPFAERLAPEIANAVDAAYQNCLAILEPFATPNSVAMTPYSSLSTAQRSDIIRVAYQFLAALLEARDALGLG